MQLDRYYVLLSHRDGESTVLYYLVVASHQVNLDSPIYLQVALTGYGSRSNSIKEEFLKSACARLNNWIKPSKMALMSTKSELHL